MIIYAKIHVSQIEIYTQAHPKLEQNTTTHLVFSVSLSDLLWDIDVICLSKNIPKGRPSNENGFVQGR